MPDYNPDKESHVDHKYVVIKANKDPDFKGVQTSKGFLKFDRKKQSFRVKDPALANEVRQIVGVDATVSRVRWPSPADTGHKYFFGALPEMPWKRIEREQKEAENAVEEGKLEQDSQPQRAQTAA